LEEVDHAEAMDLLGSASFGRLVFTLGALPAIRPVNHVVDDGEIVIRTRRLAGVSTALAAASDGALDQEPSLVVAYEADDLDPLTRMGWSVVVTGYAVPITDPARLARIERHLHPWIESVMDTAIAITPEIVTGMRLVAG
jgi:hypothetical protein